MYFFIELKIFLAGAWLSIPAKFPAALFFNSVMSGSCLTKDALSGWGIIAITFPFLLHISAMLYIAPFGFVGNLSSILPSLVEYLNITCLFFISLSKSSLSFVV